MDETLSRRYINAAKGIAIFLMLWGHCIQYCCVNSFDYFEDPVFKAIYSFHMPLFMLLSGYVFSFSLAKRDFKTLVVRRTQSLLQPIIMVQILAWFLTSGIKACLSGSFRTLLNGPWAGSFGSSLLWFLWSVLSISLVAAVAFSAVQNKILRGVVLLFGVVFVALMPNAEMNLYMYPYFITGLLWARWRPRIPQIVQDLKYLSIILFPIMLHFFRKEHYIYTSGLFDAGNPKHQILVDLFRWAIGFVGSVLALTLLEVVFTALRKIDPKRQKICRAVEKFGEKSLQIYTLSVIFLSLYLPVVSQFIMERAGYNFLTKHILLYDLVFMPLLAGGYAVALLGLSRLLEKMKLSRIIFGR